SADLCGRTVFIALFPHKLPIFIKELSGKRTSPDTGSVRLEYPIHLSYCRRSHAQTGTGSCCHGTAAGHEGVTSEIYIQQRTLSTLCQHFFPSLQRIVDIVFAINQVECLEKFNCLKKITLQFGKVLQIKIIKGKYRFVLFH